MFVRNGKGSNINGSTLETEVEVYPKRRDTTRDIEEKKNIPVVGNLNPRWNIDLTKVEF